MVRPSFVDDLLGCLVSFVGVPDIEKVFCCRTGGPLNGVAPLLSGNRWLWGGIGCPSADNCWLCQSLAVMVFYQ